MTQRLEVASVAGGYVAAGLIASVMEVAVSVYGGLTWFAPLLFRR
jgi:hypothetical protein